MWQWQKRLEQLLFQDDPGLAGAWLRPIRVIARYVYAILRDLWQGHLDLRAMSLVYTTLLSIVPFIAFAVSVLKGLGMQRSFAPLLTDFFRPLGEHGPEMADRVLGFVNHLRGDVLGSVGLAVLVWTVLSLVQKVEETFNFIWHVARVRSVGRRFTEYLSVLLIGPIVLVAAYSLLGFATAAMLAQLKSLGIVGQTVGRLGSLLIVGLVFAFLYAFVPNTRVRAAPALFAGIVTGATWVGSGFLFGDVVAYSARTFAVYAGYAVVPFAIMWIWLNWLILLTGAQFAFYLQNPRHLKTGLVPVRATAMLAERLALSAACLVADAFQNGHIPPTSSELAERLDVPSVALAPVLLSLESRGLIGRTEDDRLLLARDSRRITVAMVLEAVREEGSDVRGVLREARTLPSADRACEAAEQAVRERMQHDSLASLLEHPSGNERRDASV